MLRSECYRQSDFLKSVATPCSFSFGEAELLPFGRGHAGVLLESAHEVGRIIIADVVCHGANLTTRKQQLFCASNAQIRNIARNVVPVTLPNMREK